MTTTITVEVAAAQASELHDCRGCFVLATASTCWFCNSTKNTKQNQKHFKTISYSAVTCKKMGQESMDMHWSVAGDRSLGRKHALRTSMFRSQHCHKFAEVGRFNPFSRFHVVISDTDHAMQQAVGRERLDNRTVRAIKANRSGKPTGCGCLNRIESPDCSFHAITSSVSNPKA